VRTTPDINIPVTAENKLLNIVRLIAVVFSMLFLLNS